MIRYTLLRFLIFFGCLALLWLVGLRSPEQRPWLLVGAGALSIAVSYFALKPFREETVDKISRRVEARLEAKSARPTDEQIEDAEIAPPARAAADDRAADDYR
ncbi:MAG: DUF4229 domain-containing protein [Tetrasphaera sp.]